MPQPATSSSAVARPKPPFRADPVLSAPRTRCWRRRTIYVIALALSALLPIAENARGQGGAIPIQREFPQSPYGSREEWMAVANEGKRAQDAYIAIRVLLKVAYAWLPEDPLAPSPTVPTPRGAVEDPVDGMPIPVPIAFPDTCFPQRFVAVHPNQHLVYFATSGGTKGYICAYRFDAEAGTMTPAPGSPFPVEGPPSDSFAIDPSGTFLYAVGDADNVVAAFSIESGTGALNRITGSPYATAANPMSVVIDPTGRFVYVATSAFKTLASTIGAYAIDSATGALAQLPGSPYAVPDNAHSLAIDPLGRYVYLTAGNTLQAYGIDQVTGALKPMGTPVPGNGKVAVDPAGRSVYVEALEYVAPNLYEGVRAYRVEGSGTLTAIGGFVRTGTNVVSIAVSRSGRHVYVGNSEEKADFSGFEYSLAALKRDEATGALTPIVGSPFPMDGRFHAMAAFNVLPSQSGWVADEPIFYPLGAFGGYPPYTWSVASGTMPPGLSVDPVLGALRGTPTIPGTYAFVTRITDSRGAATTRSYRFTVPAASSPALATVVEYYNAALDHYFITWVVEEIAALDAGIAIKGWTRTNKTFKTYISTQGGLSPICRYYIPPGLGDSHFFGRGTVECDATGARNPTFVLEHPSFMHMALPIAGSCPGGTMPVYRVFSARQDANHRYTNDRAVRDDMEAKGWLGEGDGPDRVVMCGPP